MGSFLRERSVVCLGQVAAQQSAGVMQPPFDGGDGERHKVGDAGDRPIVEVEQEHERAMIGWQLLQGVPHGAARFGPGLLVSGVAARCWSSGQFAAVREHEAIQIGRLGRLVPLFTAANARRPMPGDGAQPAGELGRLAQLRQRLEGKQKRFLRHIVGQVSARWAKRLRGHQRDGRTEPAHDLVEGGQVADERGQHKRLVADSDVLLLFVRRHCVFRLAPALLPYRDRARRPG
jgi:hypothetical protein